MSRSFLFPKTCNEEITLKTKAEIARISCAGATVGVVLNDVSRYIRPGISTSTLELIAARSIEKQKRRVKIEKFHDFPTFLSISVNDTAVHGVPTDRQLGNGDIVTLDLVLKVNGWYGDAAITLPVGAISPEHARLIEAARTAADEGIRMARAGGRMGDIGEAIQKSATTHGVRLFEGLTGHGIGRDLHEGPTVLAMGEAGFGQPIVPGMVFTIEPVVTFGDPSYYIDEDGFSLKTKDGTYTAMFEHTVAVFSDRTEILTLKG